MVATHPTRRSLRGPHLAIAMMALACSCGLDAEIFQAATDRGHVVLPLPRDTVLHGQATPAAGGAVDFYTGAGSPIADVAAAVDDTGLFEARFDGTAGYVGLVAWASLGDRVVMAVLPELPRQPTVFHEERHLFVWDLHSALNDINAATTAASMVVSAAARRVGVNLDALSPAVVGKGLSDVVAELQTPGSAVAAFAQMVGRLDDASEAALGLPVFEPGGLSGEISFLSADWLAEAQIDYTGDGFVDEGTLAFDVALGLAAQQIEIGVCYPSDEIRVVFHLDMREGVKNRNCSVVDHYKWSSQAEGKAVFLAAGIHEEAPTCVEGRFDHCLSPQQIDDTNELLNGWVPNQTAMYDDGTNGDAVANDGIWTLTLVLPYIPTATSPDGAGVRLGYKYTFGLPGQDWTDAEEWPGNQRLLELEDLNGDHLVTRYDIFGDESANKDKVNALKPSKGGCGTIEWEAERNPDCAGDSRENLVDTDDDCEGDTWESPGPVAPLTIDCE